VCGFICSVSSTCSEYGVDSPNKRVIIVGDIHGSSKPFHALLNKLNYNSNSDTLIHVGDTITKGSHEGSLAVLAYMAKNNVMGVRGNHEQKVVEWRAWMEWIRGLEGGERWLAEIEERAKMQGKNISQSWVEEELNSMGLGGKWRRKIPKGWKMFSDHYKIARDMSQRQYVYLLSLPVVLYVPSAHTYIVHAGILPYDPTRDPTHWRQPLSHVPSLSLSPSRLEANITGKKKDIERLRVLQEQALLRDIPQNKDPWVKLNMRSVEKNNRVTKLSKTGTPWSEIWNAAMETCVGFGMKAWGDEYDLMGKKGKKSLPCRPSTVVYGHAASRGLDIKRWSIGTDTGCVSFTKLCLVLFHVLIGRSSYQVYGRRLSALVLRSSSNSPSSPREADNFEDDLSLQNLPYGDDDRGQILSVKCH
jgi:Calcineurin-like phosphoesterase